MDPHAINRVYSWSAPVAQRAFAALLIALIVTVAACGSGDPGSSSSAAGSAAASSRSAGGNDSVKAMTDSIIAYADASRITGSPNAKVWFILISDFQCPFCRQFYSQTYPNIKRDYVDTGLLRMAYVNLPGSGHVHARPTAEYALCAGLQGKFWEYHDALFDNFDQWNRLPGGTDYFMTMAERMGLNSSEIDLCISSGVVRPILVNDFRRSVEAGANVTPSFLIGGRLAAGAMPYADVKLIIDQALAAADTVDGTR